MSKIEKNSRKPQFAILFLLISFASVNAVFYTPALPVITRQLHINQALAQLTLVLYLVGFAIGQLCYGPISNRFGRKPVILVGIAIATVSSLFCAIAGTFHLYWLLLIFRIIQALGACVGMMMTFTMVADYYKTGTARIHALLVLSLATLPPLATTLGGFVVQYLSWQWCFYFLVFYGIFIFICCLYLPETFPDIDHYALRLRNILSGYAEQFKHGQFIIFAIFMGCTSAFIYLFAAQAPFIGMHVIGLTPAEYGLWFFLPYVGMITGCLLTWYLAHRIRIITLIRIGMVVMTILGIAMLICFAYGWVNNFSLFGIMLFIYIFEIFVFSNSTAMATLVSRNKSNASAVMNFLNLTIPVIAVQLMSLGNKLGAIILPLSLVVLMLIVIGLSFFIKGSYQYEH